MLLGNIGARLNHLTSLVMYQGGNVADGDVALTAALAFEKIGSHWVFQLGLADQLFLNGEITERVGLLLYEQLLRDPTPADWSTSPLESLAILNTPHSGPYEHWFEAVMKRGKDNQELAVEIADRARRHRFYSALPMGGRLLALRWLLEGPEELLSDQARMERQELLTRYSDYDTLAQQARKLRADLAAKPAVENGADARREQAAHLATLFNIGKQQEVLLRQIAVRREAADLIFPPVRQTKDIQKALPPGQVLLVYFATGQNIHAFLFGREKYTNWRLTAPAVMQKNLTGMLREMGHFEQNHQVTAADLSKDAWRKSGAKVLELLSQKQLDLSAKFDELVIVPDGPLWYLPFEALPIDKAGTPLISHVRVRYAPTAGLAIPYTKLEKPRPTVGVVLGKLYPHDDDTVSQTAFEQLGRAPCRELWPGLPQPPAPSSVYRSLFDELIVLDDIRPGEDGFFDWSPAQVDRNKPGASLGAWLQLPWGGPEKVILPGFHSAAENSMKRGATGNDLFMAVTGLMAAGARTVLISRWRVGGQTSFDLMREFAQELPHTTPADAWQRSVLLVSGRPLDTESEPRVKRASGESGSPNADNPFFWSGYMLADSGKLAANEEAPPPPVLNFQQKAAGQAPGKPAGLKPLAPPGPLMQPPAAQVPPPDKLPDNTKLPDRGPVPGGIQDNPPAPADPADELRSTRRKRNQP